MAVSAADVMIGTTGAVYFAASGTTLPTSVSASLASFAELGYISENGVAFAPASTTTKVKAWQNADIVAEAETEHSYTADFVCLETNEVVLGLWYSGLYDTPAGLGLVKGNQIKRGVWVFDSIAGTDKIRHVIPDGKIVARQPIAWKNGEPISYGFTVECFPDATGTKSYEYHSTVGAS